MATPTQDIRLFAGGPRIWRVAAGVTISGYSVTKPGVAVKTIKFASASSASADAQVYVSWSGPLPHPIPKGGPFLRVTNGAFAGLLIVQALVTVDGVTTTPALPLRLQKALNLRKAKPFQQFGQAYDVYTANGATGCTHTICQFIALLWTGRMYTHDQISRMVGCPNQSNVSSRYRRGLRYSEVQAFFRAIGAPYVVKLDLAPSAVISASVNGPVLFGETYSWHPEWKGFRYGTITADGKPNGFASPSGKAGKTQLSGFTGAHAGALLGVGDPGTGRVAYVMEPNHGSPSRPEKPPYDVMSMAQWTLAYTSYKRILGRAYYAVIPTKALPL